MNITEALAFIQAIGWRGSRLGMSRIRELLDRLDNPQNSLRFIHVAGTNGKGSTAAMLASILREAGFRTGLYTSPHLSAYNERIKINGMDISDEEFCAAAERVKLCAETMEDPPTEFEVITAMALLHFKEQGCDAVVLEVGLGGRADATNVISPPEAAVITNIGLEHTDILGDTLEKIAQEKAGIIKPGSPVVCYESAPQALEVIRRTCSEKGVPCACAAKASVQPGAKSLNGQEFFWNGRGPFRLPLLGDHQIYNAAVALETVQALRGKGWNIAESAVCEGLKKVRWPARFEILRHDPLVAVDGAHNPQCVQALASVLSTYLPGKKFIFILGVLEDKDIPAMIRMLLPLSFQFLCVAPDSPRAVCAEKLADDVAAQGGNSIPCGSLEDAVQQSVRQNEYPVIACGSLYMAGRIRELFYI